MFKPALLKKPLVILSLILSLNVYADITELKVPNPRSEFDLSHDYHTQLLKMALEAAAKGRPIPQFVSQFDMEEGRATLELIKGQLLDVYWLGTDFGKEQQLRAIKIPTTRGLIGFRKFIIKQQNVEKFDQVNSLQDLMQYSACQGTSWPDTVILKAAGLEVASTPMLENLFRMLNAGRCDFFPRGFHDYQNEVVARKAIYPNLVSYKGLLLHYPFAVYFFTNKENQELANWIEEGLNILVHDGRFLSFMQSHPLTMDAFPLTEGENVRYISLSNPILPADTDYLNETYWFTPKDFGIGIEQ